MESTFASTSQSLRAGHFVVSLAVHRAEVTLEPHSHAHATATVVLGGGYAEGFDSTPQYLAPLSVVIKPPGQVHSNSIDARGARSLLVELSDAGLRAISERSSLFDTARVVDLTLGSELALKILGQISCIADGSSFELESLVAEFIGLVAGECRAVEESTETVWLRYVIDRLHETADTPIRLADLADETGYHPIYVARAFRRQYGVSIGAYARRLRIARAARALAVSPQHGIGGVALYAGYYDHSHMTHEFRSRTGLSPAMWRDVATSRPSSKN